MNYFEKKIYVLIYAIFMKFLLFLREKMLTDVLRIMVNNPFKENFYGKGRKSN